MGAQSDFIAERFVPSEEYKAQQAAMVQTLLAAGFTPEQLAGMFSIAVELPVEGKAEEDEGPNDL
jgi:hypothetical protein